MEETGDVFKNTKITHQPIHSKHNNHKYNSARRQLPHHKKAKYTDRTQAVD